MTTQVHHRRKGSLVEVQCPMCLDWQPLPVGENNYVVDQSSVYPMFVCINRKSGRYCDFAGEIRLSK